MGRFMFGKQENLKEIHDIALRGPEGEDLYLGYKTTSFFLGAGVYMKDDGYILGIRGQDQYYSLKDDQVTKMQATGGLPDPMPAYSIPLLDYGLGYSLWIIIAGVVVYDRIKKRMLLTRSRRRERHAHI